MGRVILPTRMADGHRRVLVRGRVAPYDDQRLIVGNPQSVRTVSRERFKEFVSNVGIVCYIVLSKLVQTHGTRIPNFQVR